MQEEIGYWSFTAILNDFPEDEVEAKCVALAIRKGCSEKQAIDTWKFCDDEWHGFGLTDIVFYFDEVVALIVGR